MKLQGRVALVTGGSSGLGRGIVKAFIKEGAKVAFCGRNQDGINDTVHEMEKELAVEVLGVKADVSDSCQVKKMFAKVLERFGTLDILVNNAAIFRADKAGKQARMSHLDLITKPGAKYSMGVTKNMSDEDWNRMIETDLNGTFYCTREALKIMEDKGYGKIINIASTAGISGSSPHSPNYSAAKAGVVGFTKSVAHEVAGAGVIVNCIAPGAIATSRFLHAMKQWGPEITSRLMQVIPLGRFGTIEEHASLAVYLASDDSNFIVGQVISPNGGMVI